MSTKHWVAAALQSLAECLRPVPHEVNELDWKARLSDHRDRLAEHLMAFANNPNGGTLAFGVDNNGQATSGLTQDDIAQITNTLANLDRDAVEPPLAIDHAAVDHEGATILLVHVPEQPATPVHRRGKSIEETWVRSGGTSARPRARRWAA